MAKALTDRQRKMLNALSGVYEPARVIAGRAEVDSRTAGAVLTSLFKREDVTVQRRHNPTDRLYEWRVVQ